MDVDVRYGSFVLSIKDSIISEEITKVDLEALLKRVSKLSRKRWPFPRRCLPGKYTVIAKAYCR